MVHKATAACGEWFERAFLAHALKAVKNHESRCQKCTKIKEEA